MDLLNTEALKKYFGEVHAVDGVSLTLRDAELLSVVGPNGSGKTTLVNLISGALKPDSGKVYFEGRDITGIPPHKRVKMGIGRSFQIPAIYENLTTLDSLLVSIFSNTNLSHVFYKTKDKFEKAKEEAINLLETLNIPLKLVGELPHGQRKLLDVAMALSLKPKLILLDEPTAGISLDERDEVMQTIVGFIRNQKIAAIIVEHDMDIVAEYSDRVIVMHEGRVLKEGGKEILDDGEVRRILIGD
ncbi:MAG: ABC transporter ATP-binding protein [Archaeoglobus sp.]|nr:ABC transporter ATP-binding protein [Archaeoglobus sp.]